MNEAVIYRESAWARMVFGMQPWFAAAVSTALLAACASSSSGTLPRQKDTSMTPRILIATTSHTRKGSTGQPTGAYLPEIAHPYEVFTKAGFAVDLASVAGGAIPLDGVEDADATSQAFLRTHGATLLAHSVAAAEVTPARYEAIYFAGGHGAMWDLPENPDFARVAAAIYERGGAVAAVCHGPAALVNVKLSSGAYLVAGKQVSAFTNEEERAVKLEAVVPFLLADKLVERGAVHLPAPNWQAQVVVSERLVTGQNPASAAKVAQAVVDVLRATR